MEIFIGAILISFEIMIIPNLISRLIHFLSNYFFSFGQVKVGVGLRFGLRLTFSGLGPKKPLGPTQQWSYAVTLLIHLSIYLIHLSFLTF